MSRMHEPVSIDDKETFTQTICKSCALCLQHTFAEIITPNFCMLVYDGDKNRFLGFLYQLQKLRKGKSKYNLASFEAFCGLFCNSFPSCPNKSEKCEDITVRVSCYASFVRQWGQIIPEKVLNQIYALYSGVDLDEVGRKLSFDLRRLRKKERKAIRASSKQTMNMIGSALAILVTGKAASVAKSKKLKKVKKRVHTSTFHNDDDTAWSDKIKELLRIKENYDDETDD